MNKFICREIQGVKVYMTLSTTTTTINPTMPLASYIRVLHGMRRNGKAYWCIKM